MIQKTVEGPNKCEKHWTKHLSHREANMLTGDRAHDLGLNSATLFIMSQTHVSEKILGRCITH